jgi:hypothetical protein
LNYSLSSFGDKEKAGAKYFENIFKAPPSCPIQEILGVVQKFPRVFSEDMNKSLMEEVTEDELKGALFSMQSGKSPGPDGFPGRIYKNFYELIKSDLLLMIRESQRSG